MLGNNIDVYMEEPFIKDLNKLSEVDVNIYDASSKKTFQLHAIFIWTINDFIAYGYLSGWCIYDHYAYPYCSVDKFQMFETW